MGHVFAEGQVFEKKCLVLRSRVFQIFVPWPWRSKCFKVLIIAVVFLLCSENVEKQWAPSFIYSFFLIHFFQQKKGMSSVSSNTFLCAVRHFASQNFLLVRQQQRWL